MNCINRIKELFQTPKTPQPKKPKKVTSVCDYVLHADINDECAICLEPMKAGDKVSLIYCSHIFHTQCIYDWFLTKQVCPYCEQPVHL